MTDNFSEQQLVERAAIEVFQSLGYAHQDCYEEKFGVNGTLGRETSMEVVLVPRLREALKKFNSALPDESIDAAIEELTKSQSTLNSTVANRELYKSIRDGVKVSVRKEDGTEAQESVKVIDFDNPQNNDFFLTSQLWVTGEMYKRRADLVGFVNGLPLIFIELKASHKRLKNAYDDNLTDYRDTIPQLFWHNDFIILSNGSNSRIGSITAQWEHFSEWKKINDEGEEGVISLDTIIKGTCQKERFLDILENFILYQDAGGALVKVVAKNHQYLGVNNAVQSFKDRDETKGKLGIYWHTQGSGKSFSMIFFSQKVLRKCFGDYTFLIVTDRKELDEQIYNNFASCGAVTEQEVHAESGEHLKQLLKENHRNVFTLIHKFRTEGDAAYPVISDRKDIIVIADEAHRTQYDQLAMNMRRALPNACFIAFTATPLIDGEERTKECFGDYVSIYSFKESVIDRATVPLYYENRIPEVQLTNEQLNEEMENIIEDALLDERQEERLIREFTREYHIITRDSRLERVAEDIVAHFAQRGYLGKAMVVSVDKATAVRMYDKVKKYWPEYIKRLEADLQKAQSGDEKIDIHQKIKFMKETDMAVVVSSGQNEIDQFRRLGLDIQSHRKRMIQEDLATKFKDSKNPLRIVFVCAMWMTGFDVPCLSTLYLDKPMRNHTLMQTIARANRVFADKPNGLIVDYIGIFRNLQKALAIYNPGGDEIDYPVRPKDELLGELGAVVQQVTDLCSREGISVQGIMEAKKLETVKLIDDAVDILVATDGLKKEYLSLSNNMRRLYKAILPDPQVERYRSQYMLYKTIAHAIYSLVPVADISEVQEKVEELLDRSVDTKDYVIKPLVNVKIDLSKIDFDALKRRFVEKHKHIEAEKLKNTISQKLADMMRINKARITFLEKFQELLNGYNSGTMNVEEFFKRLMEFTKALDVEDKRALSEQLTDEELAVFDLLCKPKLTKKEAEQVKLTSKRLLERLKDEKFVLDWRKRQQTRADVLLTIQTVLDEGLPESYTKPEFEEKSNLVYQHVYDSYFGQEKSVYASEQ